MKRNRPFKALVYIFFITIVFVSFYIYCNARRYINLEYIAESSYDKVDNEGIELFQLPEDCQLTWFGYYPQFDIETINAINEEYGTNFDKSIITLANETLEKGNKEVEISCFVSIGRKLKLVYYDSERYSTGSYDDEILPCPVFEREYAHKIYLYVTDKTYHMMGEPELLGEYLEQFNIAGDIPFEER